MHSKFDSDNYLTKLKAAAQTQLLSPHSALNTIDIDNREALIHELQTHQIELELQNNELQQTQIKLYESLKKYSDLFDFAPNGDTRYQSKCIYQSLARTPRQGAT